MSTSLRITNLRGIRVGQIDGLTELNVFVGPNNAGKTTCLEAAALAASSSVPDLGQLLSFLALARGHQTSWTSLVHREGDGGIQISSVNPSGDTIRGCTLKEGPSDRGHHFVATVEGPEGRSDGAINMTPTGDGRMFVGRRVRFVTALRVNDPNVLEIAVSDLERAGRKAELHSLLRTLVPGLTDLRILMDGGRPNVHVEEKGGVIWPISSAGDGFKRLCLLAAVLASRQPMIVIEDPEAFLHESALKTLSGLLLRPLGGGAQFFVTTHSADLVRRLVSDSNEETPLAFFSLGLQGGQLTVRRFGPGDAEYSLPELLRPLGFEG